MRRFRESITTLLILFATLPMVAVASDGVLNTFSPYTIYGLGELSTQGTLQTRSMGGAGVAVRSRSSINLLNPAAYSSQIQRSVLFDFGMEGSSYMLSQNTAEGQANRTYVTGGFKEFAFQLPLAKGLGFAISLTPYSSVGYDNLDDLIMADYYVEFQNTGSGDIAEGKFGVGWEIIPGLSLGFAAQYYWGDITRNFSVGFLNVTAAGSVYSMTGTDNLSISSLKGQAGLQWDVFKRRDKSLTLGATYDLGGDLSPRYIRVVDGENTSDSYYAQSDTSTLVLIQPSQLAVGLSYASEKLSFAADYSMQDWESGNESISYLTQDGMEVRYCNVAELRLGVEYTPRYSDVRNYFNRVNYRVGARFGNCQYQFNGSQLPEYAVTAGMGFPINMMGITRLNFGLEWGSVGSLSAVSGSDVGLVRQNQFKFALSFTMFGDDYWFRRYLID